MTVEANITKAQRAKQVKRAERRAAGLTPDPPRVIREAKGFTDLKQGWTLTLDEFCDRAGLGPTALRRVQRGGLVVTPVGIHRYVRESDWNAYLKSQSDAARKAADRKRLNSETASE